ncbi:hypothetical protein [Streptomyces sp. NPDC088812]|uniref:hypothetical protein n=1 Tax=Streptomyces sp. NPDC088812 TaxID=3365905 RepID=UPI0037FE5EB6
MTTPAPLTPQQLDEIEARRKAATAGPWGVYVYGGDSLIEIAADLEETGCGYSARRTIARFDEEPLDNDPTHREWTAEEDWAQVQADAAFIAHAPTDVNALLAEVRRLTAELAEEKASHDPRLRCLLVKAAPDKDMYIGWSNICEMPAGVWSRETALEYGFPPSRLDRADATGTSSHIGDGAWDDQGFIAEQRGWLRRDRLGDYAVEYLHGDREAAFALLEPFDDDPAASPAP